MHTPAQERNGPSWGFAVVGLAFLAIEGWRLITASRFFFPDLFSVGLPVLLSAGAFKFTGTRRLAGVITAAVTFFALNRDPFGEPIVPTILVAAGSLTLVWLGWRLRHEPDGRTVSAVTWLVVGVLVGFLVFYLPALI